MVQSEYADIIVKEARAHKRNGSHSALSMLEYCYADDTDECTTYRKCLPHVLMSRFTEDNYEEVYEHLGVHMDAIFPPGSSLNSRSQFGSTINHALENADFHEDKTPAERAQFITSFDGKKNVALSKENKDIIVKEAEQKRSQASGNPIRVPEVVIIGAVKHCKKIIEESTDGEAVVNAIAFILLMVCGARPRGLFTQIFKAFTSDLPNVPLVGDESPSSQYMTSNDNIIAATRVAKERSQSARAAKATKKNRDTHAERKRLKRQKRALNGKAEVEESDDDDEDDDAMVVGEGEINDKIVTSPLLPFITRDEFFQYLKILRTAPYTNAMLKKHGLPVNVDDWSDALVRGETNKSRSLEEFVKEFFLPIGTLVKKLFNGYTKKFGG